MIENVFCMVREKGVRDKILRLLIGGINLFELKICFVSF